MQKVIKLNEFWTASNDERWTKFKTPEEAQAFCDVRGGVVVRHGAQKDFVLNDADASGYFGGVGSGKTFAGIVKGLNMSQQPIGEGMLLGPTGLIGASSEGALKKIIVPQFFQVMEGSGLWKTGKRATSYVKSEMLAKLTANCPCADPHSCEHECHIYLASLHDPDELRGMELSWFFIDEGRNVTKYAWDVLWGRLRQGGDEEGDEIDPLIASDEEVPDPQSVYRHAGWVCSTPNGYDWQYNTFHPESGKRLDGALWFNAPTLENLHLPRKYRDRLIALYHGRFYEQEVEGKFVGITQGAVFFEWDAADAGKRVVYDPHLPLYSDWDFGIADETVIIFWQLAWRKEMREQMDRREAMPGDKPMMLPVKRCIGALEGSGKVSGEWAGLFKDYCRTHFAGRQPDLNIGDPAGRQRQQVSGTSVIEDLATHNVVLTPAPKKPVDYAVRIANSMMADHRVLVDRDNCERLPEALASHRWPVDASGLRTGPAPVHDWTSHYGDAFRYGITVVIPFYLSEEPTAAAREYEPNMMGYVMDHVLSSNDDEVEEDRWLGPDDDEPFRYEVGLLGPRGAA